VVNVQGDEPLMDPAIPQRLLFNLKNKPGWVWTAVRKATETEWGNMDIVKCSVRDGLASDFSRLGSTGLDYVHIGVYGYSGKRLKEYLSMKPAVAERDFNLEQLRWREPLACIMVDYNGIGVDRPEHIKMVEERLKA
jgi:CMP-2-keto-3-deoxyoctulosonic acid synthetase